MKKGNFFRRNLSTILLSIAILAVFFLAIGLLGKRYRERRKMTIEENQFITTAKVIDESFVKGYSVKYEYSYKRVKYSVWMDDYDMHFKIGENYNVHLDSVEPNTSYLVK